ncbi:Protein virilizer [Dirofilaria immitis]
MMAIVVMMDGNGSGGLKYEMSTYAFFQSCTTRTPISSISQLICYHFYHDYSYLHLHTSMHKNDANRKVVSIIHVDFGRIQNMFLHS